MVLVALDLELHEVAEFDPTRFLQAIEQITWRAHHAEVDVLRRSRALQAHFEHQPSLQHDGVAGQLLHASQEAFEHEQLTTTSQIGYRRGRVPQALLQRLLERCR